MSYLGLNGRVLAHEDVVQGIPFSLHMLGIEPLIRELVALLVEETLAGTELVHLN